MQINLPATLTARYCMGRWDDATSEPERGQIEISFGQYLVDTLVPTESEDATCRYENDDDRHDEVEKIVAEWLMDKLSVDDRGTQPCVECFAIIEARRFEQHYAVMHSS